MGHPDTDYPNEGFLLVAFHEFLSTLGICNIAIPTENAAGNSLKLNLDRQRYDSGHWEQAPRAESSSGLL